jgi:hypothetical protein
VIQPPLTSFVPTSTSTFSNFSFFMHGVSTIEVLSRSHNLVTRLQLGSGKYSVVARREGPNELRVVSRIMIEPD